MKQSVVRICSAFLLLSIAIAVCIAFVGSAVEREVSVPKEPQIFVWIDLPLQGKSLETIRLYTADGALYQELTADTKGVAAGKLLPCGAYYAVTDSGCTEFSVEENAAVNVLGGCGWFDGTTLHLAAEAIGSVTLVRQGGNGELLDYTLENQDSRLRQVLRCGGENTTASCLFNAVPYGTYRLEENGTFLCNIILSAEAPDVTVSLP